MKLLIVIIRCKIRRSLRNRLTLPLDFEINRQAQRRLKTNLQLQNRLKNSEQIPRKLKRSPQQSKNKRKGTHRFQGFKRDPRHQVTILRIPPPLIRIRRPPSLTRIRTLSVKMPKIRKELLK